MHQHRCRRLSPDWTARETAHTRIQPGLTHPCLQPPDVSYTDPELLPNDHAITEPSPGPDVQRLVGPGPDVQRLVGHTSPRGEVATSLDWRLSLCWENSRKRSTTTFNQRDKYFFCIYCIHKLFKLTFAYMFSVISDL